MEHHEFLKGKEEIGISHENFHYESQTIQVLIAIYLELKELKALIAELNKEKYNGSKTSFKS